MAEIRTEREILADLERFLRHIRPDLDTTRYGGVSDLVLVPVAIGARLLRGNLETIADLQLLSNVRGADLDREGENLGLTRKIGGRATGQVRFYAVDQPQADITIPAGTILSTVFFQLDQTISYQTTVTRTIPGGSGALAFKSTDTNRYEISVPVEAVDPGVRGNVGAGKIVTISGSITGIDGVENVSSIVGGRDRETDDVFRARIRRRMVGRERNLRRGIESYLINTFDFFDSSVIRIDDVDSDRSDGVDVYTIDDSTAEATTTFVHYEFQDTYVVPRRPLISVSGVAGESYGVLTQGIHYETERDTVSEYAYSTQARDQVRITPEGHRVLLDGEIITVVYEYASEVESAQTTLDLPENKTLTTNVIVKRAIRFDTVLRLAVTFFGGFDVSIQQERIRLALGAWFDNLKLGDPVQISDIVVVVQTGVQGISIESVDQVIVREVSADNGLGDIRVIRGSTESSDDQIEFTRKEYARFSDIVFTSI